MELGGNLPDSLIEHAMLAAPEAIEDTVDNERVMDSAELDPTRTNEAVKVSEVLDEEQLEVEQPLKAAGGQ